MKTTKTRKLGADEWGRYFDRLSKSLKVQTVSILVEGLDLGVQPETERVALTGIIYDRADDAIEIAMDGLAHRIFGPASVFVQEDAGGALVSLKVTDEDGREQIIELESALALPSRRTA
jgi:hypothetical protein